MDAAPRHAGQTVCRYPSITDCEPGCQCDDRTGAETIRRCHGRDRPRTCRSWTSDLGAAAEWFPVMDLGSECAGDAQLPAVAGVPGPAGWIGDPYRPGRGIVAG